MLCVWTFLLSFSLAIVLWIWFLAPVSGGSPVTQVPADLASSLVSTGTCTHVTQTHVYTHLKKQNLKQRISRQITFLSFSSRFLYH